MSGEHIDRLDERRMRRLLPSLFAALDSMRAVDLSAASGFGGWRADGRYQPWYPAWRNIDFGAAARAHYDAIALDVPRFAERLSCYALRIGIEDMAYSAYRKRWDQVEWNARRTLEIARA